MDENSSKLNRRYAQCPRMNLNFFQVGQLLASVLVIVPWLDLAKAADPTDISRLRADLMLGYDRNARPTKDGNATVLTMHPYLRGFEFDESRSIFTMHCWTILSWNDDHIKWVPKDYGNLTSIHFASWELWKPDIGVYNNFDQSEIDHFGYTRIVAGNTGTLVWVPPSRFQVGCEEDLRKWPYDTQTCNLILGSWAHDGASLDLQIPVNMTKISGQQVVENREFEMVSTKIEKKANIYGSFSYPDITMTVTIRRRSGTHTCAVVAPAVAISIAILVSFWLRPGASERLTLILLIILINAIYLNYVYTQIFTHGDRVPLVLLFYRDSLIMVSVALIWTVCLRYVATTKRTSLVPLPGFVVTLLTSLVGKILCLDPRPSQGGVSSDTDDEGKLVSNGNPYQEDWAWLAHLLDRVAFVLYLIVYIIFYAAML